MKTKSALSSYGSDSEVQSGAAFSRCRVYRWTLWRRWDFGLPPCVFVGLNPSTADETEDDPTIRRCIGFAKRWSFGGLIMLNAYGFRSTDPKGMKIQFDPIGDDNDTAIELVARAAVDVGGLVVAAWGTHCEDSREADICQMIARPIHCLGRTKSGRPRHPLYLRADTEPELFWSPSADEK